MQRIAGFSPDRLRGLRRHATGGLSVMAVTAVGCAASLVFGSSPFTYVRLVLVVCFAFATFYSWKFFILRDHLARHGGLAIYAEGDELVVFAPYRGSLKLRELNNIGIANITHRHNVVEVITFETAGKVLQVESALYDLPASKVVETVKRFRRAGPWVE